MYPFTKQKQKSENVEFLYFNCLRKLEYESIRASNLTPVMASGKLLAASLIRVPVASLE